MNNIQKVTTPKRIVAFILLVSQTLMSCGNFNTLRKDEIRPIEKKVSKQSTNLDQEKGEEKQILSIVVESEHLVAEQANLTSPRNNEIVYLISDGRNEAEENSNIEVRGENTSQQLIANPMQLQTRESDKVSSAIEVATQQRSALLTSRIIQKGEERAENTLDQQKSLILYRYQVKKRRKEDKLTNQRTVTDNEPSNLALSLVKENSYSNRSKKEVAESAPFILYTKGNHQVCFNHPDDKQVQVIANIPTTSGAYPPLYLPVIHSGFQLDINQLATYPIKYQQNGVHICFPVNDPKGIGYVRIEDSGLKGGGRISIDGDELIQAITRGYGTLGREPETMADWRLFLGTFTQGLTSVDLALTSVSHSSSFDPGNMRNMFLNMARNITHRNIQLENYGEAWSSIVNQVRNKIRQAQSLNIDPADYPRDSYTIVLRPNASKMQPFIGEMDRIYLTSVGGNVCMDFDNILGAADVAVVFNRSFYEFENSIREREEREENERREQRIAYVRQQVVNKTSEEIEGIESNIIKFKSQLEELNSEKITFNEEIKKVINAFQIQHDVLTRKLSTLDDLSGADEETRAKRKLLITKALALLDEIDKILKEEQERMEKQERELEIRMRRMELESSLRKANPSYNFSFSPSSSSSSSSGSTSTSRTTESREEKQATDISEAGLNFIREHEGFYPEVYRDPAPKGYPTIGYGHKIVAGEDFRGKVLTHEQALLLLSQDAQDKAVKYVRHYIKVKLLQHQFDALTSFTFNVGSDNLAESTLLKDVNSEQHKKGEQGREKIRADFMMFIKAGGKILPGLELRRGREANLFLNGIYEW